MTDHETRKSIVRMARLLAEIAGTTRQLPHESEEGHTIDRAPETIAMLLGSAAAMMAEGLVESFAMPKLGVLTMKLSPKKAADGSDEVSASDEAVSCADKV